MPTAADYYAAIIEVPAPELTFLPIDEAPVRPGKTFGDCLLAYEDANRGADWIIGYWNGEDWRDRDNGFQIKPIWWALLPPVTGRPPEHLSRVLTAAIINREYDYAARLIVQLADEVAALRRGNA